MSTRVHFVVELTVHDGKLDTFERIAQEMIAHTRQESGALAYEWFWSADRKRCRILETYADADAVLAHINGPAVQDGVPRMLGVSKLDRFEVYGDPGPQAAATLKGVGVEIFAAWDGFSR
jgi:quinol monooxygenase YgiN